MIRKTIFLLGVLLFSALAMAQGPNTVRSFHSITGTGGIEALGPGSVAYSNNTVIVQGFSAVGDGGGGNFRWNNTSTASTDGCTIFAASGVSTGRWVRQPAQGAQVTPQDCGAKGDDSTNDYTAMSNIIAYAAANGTGVYMPGGYTYKINTGLSFNLANTTIDCGGSALDFTGVASGYALTGYNNTAGNIGYLTNLYTLAHCQLLLPTAANGVNGFTCTSSLGTPYCPQITLSHVSMNQGYRQIVAGAGLVFFTCDYCFSTSIGGGNTTFLSIQSGNNCCEKITLNNTFVAVYDLLEDLNGNPGTDIYGDNDSLDGISYLATGNTNGAGLGTGAFFPRVTFTNTHIEDLGNTLGDYAINLGYTGKFTWETGEFDENQSFTHTPCYLDGSSSASNTAALSLGSIDWSGLTYPGRYFCDGTGAAHFINPMSGSGGFSPLLAPGANAITNYLASSDPTGSWTASGSGAFTYDSGTIPPGHVLGAYPTGGTGCSGTLTVNFSSGAAAATGYANASGNLSYIRVTTQGSYTSAPTITSVSGCTGGAGTVVSDVAGGSLKLDGTNGAEQAIIYTPCSPGQILSTSALVQTTNITSTSATFSYQAGYADQKLTILSTPINFSVTSDIASWASKGPTAANPAGGPAGTAYAFMKLNIDHHAAQEWTGYPQLTCTGR